MLFKHWICMPLKKHGHLLIVVGLKRLILIVYNILLLWHPPSAF